MCTFLETQTDEGLHHGYCAIAALLEPLPTRLRQPASLDIDVLAADRTFQHLDCRVMGAGPLLNDNGDIEHVARCLQPIIEGKDGLSRNRCAQGSDFPIPFAALESVDTCPFADVVAVGRAALEKL